MLRACRALIRPVMTLALPPRCAATPPQIPAAPLERLLQKNRFCSASSPPLRLELGAAVECRIGQDTWVRGSIIGRHYREPSWPEGKLAPYQDALRQKLGEKNDVTLKELRAFLAAEHGIDAAIATIHSELKRMDWTRKKSR